MQTAGVQSVLVSPDEGSMAVAASGKVSVYSLATAFSSSAKGTLQPQTSWQLPDAPLQQASGSARPAPTIPGSGKFA